MHEIPSGLIRASDVPLSEPRLMGSRMIEFLNIDGVRPLQGLLP